MAVIVLVRVERSHLWLFLRSFQVLRMEQTPETPNIAYLGAIQLIKQLSE